MKRRTGGVTTPAESLAVETSPTRPRAISDYLNVSKLETSQDSVAIQDEPLLLQQHINLMLGGSPIRSK